MSGGNFCDQFFLLRNPKLCQEIRSSITRIAFLQQEGQVALNRSPEFCIKLTYRNLLIADHVPGAKWP